jgi:hypothetical protein
VGANKCEFPTKKKDNIYKAFIHTNIPAASQAICMYAVAAVVNCDQCNIGWFNGMATSQYLSDWRQLSKGDPCRRREEQRKYIL